MKLTAKLRRLGAIASVGVLSIAGPAAVAAAVGVLPRLTELTPLPLHYGINTVADFAPDGRPATIVMAHRENGNAHSYEVLLVTIDGSGTAGARGRLPELAEVEQSDGGYADGVTIEPFDGENEISASRLARARIDGVPATVLLAAERHTGSAPLTDPSPVTLRVWRLNGPHEEIGPRYRFRLVGAATTTRRYCNATTALHQELGVPFPDGWDNEDTADGCRTAAAVDRRQAAVDMASALDVTSFPNSIGPARRAGARTFEQYGFTIVQSFDDGWVDVDKPDHSWAFHLFVLENGADHKLLCVTEQAENGGTYHASSAVDVARGSDGLWTAQSVRKSVPGCSEADER